ncbi:RES family NAD+ phosphorylase [Marinobacterium marinum]|uniref:RES family NAD+ phosphorylase n=1 Tax=Marinobacterium marinum TaxID=2756129 RepID=UPI002E1D62BF
MATLGYVDTLEEQALLEDMLEDVKPVQPEAPDELHYLLKTPFRYPPLQWGSRFGSPHEPSLFYGGLDIGVTLAESAYYRFVFWYSIQGVPVKKRILTEHTLFSVDYVTSLGVQLQSEPFRQHRDRLIHPRQYADTQAAGIAMRQSGVEAFEYESARIHDCGDCVALFTPAAFVQTAPTDTHQWFCEVSATEVSFRRLRSKEVSVYALQDFLVDDTLPLPA